MPGSASMMSLLGTVGILEQIAGSRTGRIVGLRFFERQSAAESTVAIGTSRKRNQPLMAE
jgi:hypothetical protein